MKLKSEIHIVLLSIFVCLSNYGNSQTQIVYGEVSGTWQADTIMVVDHIYVADGNSLTINPGVVVLFDGHYRFDVHGCVKANGNSNDSIIFSVTDTTSFSNFHVDRGGWHGLRFNTLNPVNDSSILNYCSFRYGKAIGDSLGEFGGAVFIKDFGKIRLSNCLITNNYAKNRGGGLSGSGAGILIENCRFNYNQAGYNDSAGIGGGLYFDYSMPKILNSVVDHNIAYRAGGGISLWFTDPLITNTAISNNWGAFGGGANFFFCGNTYPLTGNLFYGNSSYFFGGAMTCNGTHHIMANNTIVYNHGGGGGGIFLNSSSFPTYINNIFWGNISPAGGDQIYIWDVFSAPNFYFNDVEGGKEAFGGTGGVGSFIGTYENNIEVDPLFEETGTYNYQLQEISPCINAGKQDTTGLNLPLYDLAGNPRIVDNRIDIGAFEYPVPLLVKNDAINTPGFDVCPNPFYDETVISFSELNSNPELIKIYDARGIEIKSWNFKDSADNMSRIVWDGKENSGVTAENGLYFITVFFKNTVISSPVIFHK